VKLLAALLLSAAAQAPSHLQIGNNRIPTEAAIARLERRIVMLQFDVAADTPPPRL
jgi:hypothetical protein